MSEPVKAFKGFDKNFQCRGYQYKVGETYTHEGKVKACKEGFHACTYPLDVFCYYSPAESRYAFVLMDGETSTHNEDSKIASAKITIEAEITIPQMVKSAIEWIMGQIKGDAQVHATDDHSHASNTGNCSAASSTGYRSAASVDGKHSVAMASGYKSRAKACEGSAIVLCYRDVDYNLIHIRAGIAGKDVKSDTWYQLDAKGEFVEA